MKTNVILNGKYKGYKLIFNDNNKSEIIDLEGRIKSVCIKGNELYNKNDAVDYYNFQIYEEQEFIKCLTSFDMYLRLIVYGMQVPIKCLGI